MGPGLCSGFRREVIIRSRFPFYPADYHPWISNCRRGQVIACDVHGDTETEGFESVDCLDKSPAQDRVVSSAPNRHGQVRDAKGRITQRRTKEARRFTAAGTLPYSASTGNPFFDTITRGRVSRAKVAKLSQSHGTAGLYRARNLHVHSPLSPLSLLIVRPVRTARFS